MDPGGIIHTNPMWKARRQLFFAIKLRQLGENVGTISLDEDKIIRALEWVRNKDYENWTIVGSQITISQFARFYKVALSEDVKKLLKIKKVQNKLKANGLITPKNMNKIIMNCINLRDRDLSSLLCDSGLGHVEVLNLKNRDLDFGKYRYLINVPKEGKTGTRSVRVFNSEKSYRLPRRWIRDHPDAINVNANLFCKIERDREGNSLSYNDLNLTLGDILKRA